MKKSHRGLKVAFLLLGLIPVVASVVTIIIMGFAAPDMIIPSGGPSVFEVLLYVAQALFVEYIPAIFTGIETFLNLFGIILIALLALPVVMLILYIIFAIVKKQPHFIFSWLAFALVCIVADIVLVWFINSQPGSPLFIDGSFIIAICTYVALGGALFAFVFTIIDIVCSHKPVALEEAAGANEDADEEFELEPEPEPEEEPEPEPEPKKPAEKEAKKAEPKKEEAKAATKVEPKKEEKVKPAKKAEEKPAPKAEPKKEVKPAPKAEPKKEVKPAAKAEPKKEAKKAEPKKEAPKAEPKKAEKPADKKVEAKPAPKAEPERQGTGKVYHISRRPELDKWQVKAAGAEKALKLFDTQKEAIEYAKQFGSYRIHSMSGKIRKG